MTKRGDPTYVLGLSAFYHDSAAALLRDGQVLAAAQEERFSRIKHDMRLPLEAMAYCLREANIQPSQVGYVAFYEKPLRKLHRQIQTFVEYAPTGLSTFVTSMSQRVPEGLTIARELRRSLGVRAPVLFAEHHQSHAASAFFPSPFETAAVLTVDGVGEWATSTYGLGDKHTLTLLGEMRFPHSLGLLYSAFTQYLGFRVNSDEYKVMGLAAYGRPRHAKLLLEELVDLRADGSLRLNLKYFDLVGTLGITNDSFERLLGAAARPPGGQITQLHMDIASSIQHVTEEAMLRMSRYVSRVTRSQKLCMAGGVALNCVANGRILREGPFKHVWIQPAAGDAGGAVGAALAIWHQYLGQSRHAPSTGHRKSDGMRGALLGPRFDDEEIAETLKGLGATFSSLPRKALLTRTATALAEQKVVGWLQGRMEFGPRALGNRSILADPRSPGMQATLNAKIKFREAFRPFAPAVLDGFKREYFDLAEESPYMLIVAPVKTATEARPMVTDSAQVDDRSPSTAIPAVTHVDGSARVQTLVRSRNETFYELVEEYHRLTGCPMLVNTSFNVRGEPIVCSPADAYRCFMATGLDVLVCGNCYMEKERQTVGSQPSTYRPDSKSRNATLLRLIARPLLAVAYLIVLWPVARVRRLLGLGWSNCKPGTQGSYWMRCGTRKRSIDDFMSRR